MEISARVFEQINDVESWLSNYDSIKASIENLKQEYDELEKIDTSGVDISREATSKTNKFNSEVENIINRIEVLKKRIEYMKNKMQSIDRALGALTDTERKVIEHYYIKGQRYYEFTCDIGASERSCKRIKRGALDKIRIALYGIR